MMLGIKKELPVLAILTAAGYVSCFTFQFGILLNYGIPNDLASVDINSLLFSMVMVSLFSVCFIFPATILYYYDDKGVKISARTTICILLLNAITSYFISSVIIGYYNFSFTNFYAITIFLIAFFCVLAIELFMFGVMYAQKLVKKHSEAYQKITPKYLTWLVMAAALALVPGFMGTFYAKANMATSFYNDTDYFFVLENSKGIIVISCNEKNGVSYKRIKSDEANFVINYNTDVKIKVNECLSKWAKEQRKVVKL